MNWHSHPAGGSAYIALLGVSLALIAADFVII
jgi:hypothetical protein